MLKCKVCGKEFEANMDRHYISRDEVRTGALANLSNSEVKLYDSFDCPSCGCQVLAQERKREVCEVCEEEE